MSYARVFLVYFNINEFNNLRYINDYINLSNYLLDTYQLIDVNKGDLIENVSNSGYISEGRYMIDINKNRIVIVPLNYNLYRFGIINTNFTFPEYKPEYWDDYKMKSFGGFFKSYWYHKPYPIIKVNNKLIKYIKLYKTHYATNFKIINYYYALLEVLNEQYLIFSKHKISNNISYILKDSLEECEKKIAIKLNIPLSNIYYAI